MSHSEKTPEKTDLDRGYSGQYLLERTLAGCKADSRSVLSLRSSGRVTPDSSDLLSVASKYSGLEVTPNPSGSLSYHRKYWRLIHFTMTTKDRNLAPPPSL